MSKKDTPEEKSSSPCEARSVAVRWLDAPATEGTLFVRCSALFQADGLKGHQVSYLASRDALPESESGVDGRQSRPI